LRIEDTDVERSQGRFRDELMAEMRWLGLDWDEGPDIGGPSAPYSQAERGAFYATLFAIARRRNWSCRASCSACRASRRAMRGRAGI
jgi:glutamyl/glutaminyl-tRNA synthetase